MKERDRIKAKFGGKCAYCGEVLPDKGWHVDHIKPVCRGREWDSVKRCYGRYTMLKPENDTFENKIPACASCNINKHGMSIEEFRQLIEGFINSLNLRMVQYKIAKRYGLIKETGIKVVFYFETKCK